MNIGRIGPIRPILSGLLLQKERSGRDRHDEHHRRCDHPPQQPAFERLPSPTNALAADGTLLRQPHAELGAIAAHQRAAGGAHTGGDGVAVHAIRSIGIEWLRAAHDRTVARS